MCFLPLVLSEPLLQECGAEFSPQLRSAGESLLEKSTCGALDKFIDLAHEKLRSSPSNAYPWRRLFTDASILRSLADLLASKPTLKQTKGSIARLDRAIIVAGAAGPGRLELVIRLINKIQQNVDSTPFIPRAIITSAPQTHVSVRASKKEILCLTNPPSFTSFQTKHSQNPFIIRNYAGDWPALQEHPWASNEYLRQVAGPCRVVPVEIGSDYRNDNWSTNLMDWEEFLTRLDTSETEEPVVYLAQHDLMMQFPTLREDIQVPDYVYASLSSSSEYTTYRPPGNDEGLIINAWLGPRGTLSPAHTDPYFNLYVQVVGRKTIWLAPPAVSPWMDAYSAQTLTPSMSNTSRLDVLTEAEDTERRDFWTNVVPEAMSTILEPGDLLFIPSGWWHSMRSEDKSFSVSMWF